MKNNKLAIVFVVIIVLLVGWLIVSRKNAPIENKPNDELKETQAKVEDQNGSSGATLGKGSSKFGCLNPSITVVSPNGGEIYKVGQSVTFKWKTCGLAATAHVTGSLIGISNPNDSRTLFGQADDQKIVRDKKSLNDGQITLNLASISPTDPAWVKPGMYKFKVSIIDLPGISDESNATFTLTR